MTLRFAVLGEPVAHSKSPRIHAAGYAARGLPHRYEAILTRADELEGRVRELRAGVYAGLNVTVPHKQRILAYVDEVAPSAASVGAANTLVRVQTPTGARVVAHNTDVPALAEEIRRLAPERAWGGLAGLVIGSGGAARAALASLASLGLADVRVRARSEAKARLMIDEMKRSGGLPGTTRARAEALAAQGDDATFAVVVQATSAGMVGADSGAEVAEAVAWRTLDETAVALDVVYAPPETLFLAAARGRGLRAACGLGMLAGQGALAFSLWLGGEPPREAMLAALG